MGFRSAAALSVVANVVVGLSDADLEFGIAGDAERFACAGPDPLVAALEFVFAIATHTFHDLGRACAKGQSGWQNHTHREFGAIGQRQTVADAFAIKVNIGLGFDGDAVDFFGGHGSGLQRAGDVPRQ